VARRTGSTETLVHKQRRDRASQDVETIPPNRGISRGAPIAHCVHHAGWRRSPAPDPVRYGTVLTTERKAMTSPTSGALVYWNAHTGFGEIDFDSGEGRVGIYRADLLRAGVKAPQVGDRFIFSTEVAANGARSGATTLGNIPAKS
jgi:hypothetical protein